MADDITPVEIGKTPVERMSPADYAYLKALLCPYCAAKLPDSLQIERRLFMHVIPGTDEIFECQAMALRLARGCIQDALRRQTTNYIEE